MPTSRSINHNLLYRQQFGTDRHPNLYWTQFFVPVITCYACRSDPARMSRRAPNPAAERAAQNQQTIKTLLKLEGNKSCADCKRNKHPRWASWNLGIFVCIRCSGIHRGMGTHISRVKSVDLDAWTDEQLQSVLRWGNSRANKYWESKLAPGHVPSEAKIENFIRTKYESKRWVLDGPMPDPSTLDAEGDDDIVSLPEASKQEQCLSCEPSL